MESGENIYCNIRKNALNCTLQRYTGKFKHATITNGVVAVSLKFLNVNKPILAGYKF